MLESARSILQPKEHTDDPEEVVIRRECGPFPLTFVDLDRPIPQFAATVDNTSAYSSEAMQYSVQDIGKFSPMLTMFTSPYWTRNRSVPYTSGRRQWVRRICVASLYHSHLPHISKLPLSEHSCLGARSARGRLYQSDVGICEFQSMPRRPYGSQVAVPYVAEVVQYLQYGLAIGAVFSPEGY